MLQLQTKSFDICRLSKILVKYKIKASICEQLITIDGNISDELLGELCNYLTICNVQNFSSEVFPIALSENTTNNSDKVLCEPTEVTNSEKSEEHNTPEYNLIYSTVKRGEVYFCDFGNPHGSEQGFVRPAIVIQNDSGNIHSPTTIVLPCTTSKKKNFPTHYTFTFSEENMLTVNPNVECLEPSTILAENIRAIDKTRLRYFIGTMTPEFMDEVQRIIDVSLALKRSEKVITKTKTVYVEKPVEKAKTVTTSSNPNPTKEHKDLNMIQIQLLSLVDVKELIAISQTKDSDKIKAEKIITLFGFDMQRNGVQYLLNAILISPKDSYFNLDTLCESIAKQCSNVDKDEIMRLIVARIKEHFKFKKSPTIDFIRLINSFLNKTTEEEHHENNV